MCILYAVSVLSLLSAAAGAPVPCVDLIRPLDSLDKIMGKWVVVAGATNDAYDQNPLKNFGSFWVKFSPTSQKDSILFTYAIKQHVCIQFSTTATIKNNTLTINNMIEGSGVFLPANDGYLVMSYKSHIGTTTYHFTYLLGEEAKLSDSEQDMYKKQVECLGLLAPVFMDLDKELCPDEEKAPVM
ncbi:hypothetical protein JZ751_016495 [Albula glossodonta]|uniref:Lipocalin/cytosolic fatty-acid binding domain-containing protein n=1 Tax=Albula glossodonta TaxID=121402 RepID=A0A8T2NYI2_9TELE|nr:hypothetical protein JZ751_016495 [Albula glossodonta]